MIPASRFVELNKSIHDRKSFDCGQKELNDFLHYFAAKHRKAGISKTMVLPSVGLHSDICAFYTLSHTEINRRTLPQSISRKLPQYPVPVMLAAQLGVHKAAQGHGLGKITLIRALRHCYEINKHLPSYAVVVDALDEKIQRFYEQYGFEVLVTHNVRARLFLPMKIVAQLD